MRSAAVQVWVAGLCLVAAAQAEVRLPALFSDNMVVQRGRPIPVWGQAAPGEAVAVTLGTRSARTVADAAGAWRVALRPLQAGGPLDLVVAAGTNTVTATNVLVGEVWICSGQSNMEFPLAAVTNARAEVAAATDPRLRMFTVARRTAAVPQAECEGRWVVCSPATAGGFSAVGYCFARRLQQDLNVPVGMLNTSWSGSPIEPWTSLDALRATAAARERVAAYEKALADYRADRARYDQARAAALRKQDEAVVQWNAQWFENDVGQREAWHTGAAGSGTWQATTLPMPDMGAFLSNYVGFVWCRRDVEIPAGWIGRDLALNLGAVDEVDITYVNGAVVGETRDTSLWTAPRHYRVPAAVVTNQHLCLVVRVMNQVGGVGVFGAPSDYSLLPVKAAAEDKAVSLAGPCLYALGSPILLNTRPQVAVPPVPGSGWDVSTIYNAMIAPLVPYALRGAIWYQGESNAGAPGEYRELLPAMIGCWRKDWGYDFPFLYVQLANFMARQQRPVEPNSWAELRDSQTATLKTPHTGMAVIIDIGEGPDIHPKNKQDVGTRLALWALAQTYGQKLECSGPLYQSLAVKGDKAVVSFSHVGGGLAARGAPLVGFAVAGTNKVFHAGLARMDGRTVVVSAPEVPAPVAVRYAWANNPICNLYNADGLPASPFRTDDWKSADVRAADEQLAEPAPAVRP